MSNIPGIVVGCVVVWAVLFGVNVDGKHYGLNFSTNGVSVVWGK